MLQYATHHKTYLANLPWPFELQRLRVPLGLEGLRAQYTSIINLEAEEEVLLKGFQSTTRNLIRQCIKRDEPVLAFNLQPTQAEAEDFLLHYQAFAQNKQSQPMLHAMQAVRDKIQSWIQAGTAVFSSAWSAQHPQDKVYHVHLWDRNSTSARLMFSASSFRGQDPALRESIGRLNRWLHYQDFLQFKALGLELYDMGGISLQPQDSEGQKIASFKYGFGNRMMKYYYFDAAATAPDARPSVALLCHTSSRPEALAIVNQLADKYRFYLLDMDQGAECDSRRYDLVHDLTGQYPAALHIRRPFFAPEQFFYARHRSGELKILHSSEIPQNLAPKQLCQLFNQYDIFTPPPSTEYALEAAACGCFLVLPDTPAARALIASKTEGLLTDTPLAEPELRAYCKARLSSIRQEAFAHAARIHQHYALHTAAADWDEAYQARLPRRKWLRKLCALQYIYTRTSVRPVLTLLGLRIKGRRRALPPAR